MRSCLLVIMSILLLGVPLSSAPRRILSIGMSGSPRLVDNKNVRYTADIVLDSLSPYAWIRYDQHRGGVIVELIGDSVYETAKPSFTKDDPFSTVEISTFRDSISLSRLRTIIFLKTGDDWHFALESISGNTLRIQAEKPLTQVGGKHFPLVPFILLTIFSAAAAAALIMVHVSKE